MASPETIVSLYMASADSNPHEAEANLTEISRRNSPSLPVASYLIGKGIQAKQLKLLDFVKILGEYLTHEEPQVRKNGNVGLIYLVLEGRGLIA